VNKSIEKKKKHIIRVNICSDKHFTRCVSQARKVLSVCPIEVTSSVGTGMRVSASLTSSTPTLTWSCNKGMLWTAVDPSYSLPRATRREEFSSMYSPHLSESPVSGSFPERATQLSFVLTWAPEGPTSGSGGSANPYACIWDWNWDCIWMKDAISCRVTFSVIDSSSWSLICWVSSCRSSGGIKEELWDVREVDPKYCFMVTPAPAARTRPGCSGRPMAAVRTS